MCYGVRIEIGTNGERKSSTIDNDLTTREEWMLVYVTRSRFHLGSEEHKAAGVDLLPFANMNLGSNVWACGSSIFDLLSQWCNPESHTPETARFLDLPNRSPDGVTINYLADSSSHKCKVRYQERRTGTAYLEDLRLSEGAETKFWFSVALYEIYVRYDLQSGRNERRSNMLLNQIKFVLRIRNNIHLLTSMRL
ncbi:hypothetical protein F2Q69_00000005 [Brassica cretica]|uniref:Uncharacterized protein n=1 Tax=Brassica cretica TaxID=69181 RepID=A0A8S9PHR6_BRACR|nr:hypothetical protein F2Q69_00000005 [Brassica cretica]